MTTPHARGVLRNAIRTLLSTEPLLADASHVLSSTKVDEDQVPLYSVSIPSEEETTDSSSLTTVVSHVVIAATIAAGADQIEDQLDHLGEAIRAKMVGGLRVETGVATPDLKRTEFKTGQTGATLTGTVMMLWHVTAYLRDA
ncbi:hypothetical protein [Shimia ponticola]|uniref:hypothetical protein n=1 Tax=Shimia ponticola TaxID=2582893 RepID=UPI0011BEE0DD|nr:hypothetical protein [Shimia ponticola]